MKYLNKTTKICLNLFLLFTFCFLFSPNTQAQSVMGISAIPPRLEIEVKPGQTVTKEIKVRNESQSARVISTNVKDFIVTDDKGTPIQLDSKDSTDNRWAASNWVHVSQNQTKLKPGETKSLTVTVIAPDNALPGGHYAMILHTPDGSTSLDSTGAAIETNVGTLVYITVAGAVKQEAKVEKFDTPSFAEFGPVNFKTIVKNLSDIHIAPAGAITVTNLLGGQTAKLTLDNTNIFPYTSRDFENTLDKKWLLGRYKAQLQAAYGTNGNLLTATIFFWVIPWRFIILLVTTIALIMALFLLNKNKKQPISPPTDETESQLEELKKKFKDSK